MENTTPTPVTNKGSNNKLLILAALIILFIATLAYGYYQTKNSKYSPAANSSEWAEFKSEKYGFKFNYLKAWGEPKITVESGKAGKSYSINFIPTNKHSETVSLSFDSEDFSNNFCDPSKQCTDNGGLTGSEVKSKLSIEPKIFSVYDNTSFAVISPSPTQGISSELSSYHIVMLDKIKVSAVRGLYSIKSDSTCPKDKLTDKVEPGCVDKEDYSNLKSVIGSISTL